MANSAPAFTTDLGNRTDAEGAVVSLDADATDADTADTLTYSATGLPDGVTIDAATGVIGGTLSATSAGVHAVTVDGLRRHRHGHRHVHLDGHRGRTPRRWSTP